MDEKLFFKSVKNGDLPSVVDQVSQFPELVRAVDADQSTGLHWAAWKGYPEIIEFLLDSGADISAHNANDHWGTTPLHVAAHGNRKDAAKVLIERGADVNALKASGAGTPLMETEVHNATAVAKLLRAAGATG